MSCLSVIRSIRKSYALLLCLSFAVLVCLPFNNAYTYSTSPAQRQENTKPFAYTDDQAKRFPFVVQTNELHLEDTGRSAVSFLYSDSVHLSKTISVDHRKAAKSEMDPDVQVTPNKAKPAYGELSPSPPTEQSWHNHDRCQEEVVSDYNKVLPAPLTAQQRLDFCRLDEMYAFRLALYSICESCALSVAFYEQNMLLRPVTLDEAKSFMSTAEYQQIHRYIKADLSGVKSED